MFTPYLCTNDTEVFGFTVARAEIQAPEDIAPVLDFCLTKKARLLVVRCPISKIQAAQSLISRGFLLVETLVYYRGNLKQSLRGSAQSAVTVRGVRSGEEQVLAAIARRGFHDYPSHYHCDPRLDRVRCAEIYAAWIVAACRDPNPHQRVLVAEEQGKAIGFGLTRLNSPEEGEAILASVEPSCGRTGIYVYRAVVLEGIRFCLSLGAKWGVTSTILNHVLVQKIWSRLGWEPSHAVYTFHKWLDD